jgi:FtsH-binding integral membrane protein
MENFVITILIPAAVVGFVELVSRLFKKDYEAATKIAGAALIGPLLAMATGDQWTLGLVAGLGASGLITASTKVAERLSQ